YLPFQRFTTLSWQVAWQHTGRQEVDYDTGQYLEHRKPQNPIKYNTGNPNIYIQKTCKGKKKKCPDKVL
ncbi:hypothetical protein ACQP3D_29920, partial [Escherichia coli]